MTARIHQLLSKTDPELVEARGRIWAAILADPRPAVVVGFKFEKRWFQVMARPSGMLVFRYQSSAEPVPKSLEPKLVRYLAEEL